MTPNEKMKMAGIRADSQTLSAWKRKAKAAGMSLNRWANLILDSAPDVNPAQIATEMQHGRWRIARRTK